MYVTASTGWPADANGQVNLSYFFGPLTPKLDPAQATQEILRGAQLLDAICSHQFSAGQSATGDRTIYVQFATYDHGDGYPFEDRAASWHIRSIQLLLTRNRLREICIWTEAKIGTSAPTRIFIP